jgi:hypothetical protein
MQSALDVQSTFLDMSPPTTPGHFPQNDLELLRPETANSAFQLEVHLQAAPVEQCSENHGIFEQSACQHTGAHGNVPTILAQTLALKWA